MVSYSDTVYHYDGLGHLPCVTILVNIGYYDYRNYDLLPQLVVHVYCQFGQ